MSTPETYAHVYPAPFGGILVRYGTDAQEVNGYRPIHSYPLYRDGHGPECARLRAQVAALMLVKEAAVRVDHQGLVILANMQATGSPYHSQVAAALVLMQGASPSTPNGRKPMTNDELDLARAKAMDARGADHKALIAEALIAEARDAADSDEHAWNSELGSRHNLLRRLADALEEAMKDIDDLKSDVSTLLNGSS